MSSTAEKFESLFQTWKQEHRDLDTQVMAIRDWFHSQSHVVSPPLVLAAEKLSELLFALRQHFAKEDQLSRLLSATRSTPTQEIDAVCRQTEREHAMIEKRIGELISRLATAEPEFEDWTAVTREFELLVDLLEQHEEQESEHVGWLRPSGG